MTNQSPIVSFIIPVYNSEVYIAECLDSILRQTVWDIEIICINDCSSDSSEKLLNEHAAQDKRIKIINLTTNKGPGNARNIGIKHATGDFIRMVDADDFIPLDSTEKLLNAAKRYNSDFVQGGYRHCTDSGKIQKRGGNSPTTTVSNISAGKHCLLWNFDQHWTFLFNAEILKNSGTRYHSTMRNGEDVVFLAALAPVMNRVTRLPETVYYYRTDKGSTTRRKRNIAYFHNIFRTYNAVYELRIKEKSLESADYYLFHRLIGVFASNVLPSIYNDLKHKEITEILTDFKSFLVKFDIMPRILTHPYSRRGNLLISNEIKYLMTMLLHSDIEVATNFFYYLAENKIGKKIRTTKETAFRKKILRINKDLNNIQTSTSWRLTAPLRSLVDTFRKKNQHLASSKSRQMEKLPDALHSHQKIFEKKFTANSWLSDESVSGRGSTLEQTRIIRQELPEIFKKFQIKTVVDVPCGDFYWMSIVDLSGVEYLGLDIVKELIQTNNDLYANDTISFKTLNILEKPTGKADLLLSRDCLVHFCFDDIFKTLTNIQKSHVTYLLTTTFPDRKKNADIETGLWRPLNLQAPPFNFPAPIIIINENNSEAHGKYQDKAIGLWKISDL